MSPATPSLNDPFAPPLRATLDDELLSKATSSLEERIVSPSAGSDGKSLESLPPHPKIRKIAKEIYRADDVDFDSAALKKLKAFEESGYGNLPVCIAKTQNSISHDPKLLGAPSGFKFPVRDVQLYAGAGFVVVLAGDIMTMPGLPKAPAALNIDVNDDGVISGLF